MMNRNSISLFAATFATAFAAAFLTVGCTDRGLDIEGTVFSLGAQDYDPLTTKATSFDEGTLYNLFILKDNDWTARQADNAIFKSNSSGVLEYVSGDYEDEVSNTFPAGSTLSFYSTTYGSTTTAPTVDNTGTTPTITVSRSTDGSLPDLRRCALTNQPASAVSNGQLTLSYKHALTKLTFEVGCQDTDENTVQSATITNITIKDHASGTYSIADGTYSFSDSKTAASYTVYDNSTGYPVTETMTTMSAVDEALVFPNANDTSTDSEGNSAINGLVISVEFTYTDNGTTTGSITSEHQVLTSTLNTDGTVTSTPFVFLPNYHYVIQLTIMGDNAYIVAIVPQYYDWIDVEIGEDDMGQTGQPIAFNNLIWADRNLGAKIANPTNDQEWEYSRGYYYQIGRNIPYSVDYTRWTKGKDGSYTMSATGTDFYGPQTYGGGGTTNKTDSSTYPYLDLMPYPVVDGITSYDEANASEYYKAQEAYIDYDLISLEPGDESTTSGEDKYYGYIVNSSSTDYWYPSDASYNRWSDVDNQPCPTGWRLPTIDEWKGIFPISQQVGDITFYDHSGTVWYEPSSGDPETGYNSVYVGHRESTSDAYGAIYGIKYVGTSRAFRIKWEAKEIGTGYPRPDKTLDSGRGMLEISIYSTDSDDTFSITDTDSNYFLNYDWDHPSATMSLPVVGYMKNKNPNVNNQVHSLIYSGCEVVMASSSGRSTARIKILGNRWDRYIYIYENQELPANGVQVRCVRQ